jgi:hypothetical protein
MSDLFKIVLGAISATAVFVLGQAFLKFVLEPLTEQRRTIARIVEDLSYYANVYLNPSVATDEAKREARETIRRRASELSGRTDIIPGYEWWERCGLVRPRDQIGKACGSLRGLVNTVEADVDGRDRHLRAVEDALGITRVA